ncbi:MAG: hypothetical protein MRJ96_11655 [Nitrospirales bacterium]|nr:hypothetical protein [Nitrospira sp.]MDR4502095.1 hypothetical protein [Nitrospirales bacterium]
MTKSQVVSTSSHDLPDGTIVSNENIPPFYFVVVFWGKQFARYLTRYCLPSLLSTKNLPALGAMSQHKFLFCTTKEDWNSLTQTTIFLRLQKHITPHFIEIPPAPPEKSGCEHMGVGHKLAAQLAFQDRACGVFLTPDLMVSDGTVLSLLRCAKAGYKVVLTAALRFSEESWFEQLKGFGYLMDEESQDACDSPLTLTSRQMVQAGIQSFHSQTLRYEWEAPYFSSFPCACWWRVPGEDGLVLHSLSWAPFLCDYSAISTHDTSVFDVWTLDGDYIHQNFKQSEDIYVVTDSDEMMLVSWAPSEDRAQSTRPNPIKGLPVVGKWVKGGILRAAMLSGIFDELKQRIFFLPVRWHAKELTANWEVTERRAQQTLQHYLWDCRSDLPESDAGCYPKSHKTSKTFNEHVRYYSFLPMVTIGRLWMILSDLYMFRRRLTWKLGLAMRGDSEVWGRIFRRVGIIWKTLRGVPIRNL